MAVKIKRSEITSLIEYYQSLYSPVREQQAIDQSFYDDTFNLGVDTARMRVLRSGLARKIIDTPSEQMITSNPKAYVVSGNKEADNKMSTVMNGWLSQMRRQNPNPFKESVKNPLLRGETFIYLCPAPYALDKKSEYDGVRLPVLNETPDPASIYASEDEDENGVPTRVLVIFQRHVENIRKFYPNFKQSLADDKLVEWVAYYDEDSVYFQAAGTPIGSKNDDGEGVMENPYGIVPFVRRMSGMGRRDGDKGLEALIVSELRGSRDLLTEECLVRSDIASALHLYSNPRVTVRIPSTTEAIEVAEFKKQFSMEAGSVSVVGLPDGYKFEDIASLKPTQEMFNHLAEINARIMHRHPVVGAGSTTTNSGRQDDLMGQTMMKRYASIVENTESMFAVGLEMSLKIIKKLKIKIPDISKEDLDRTYHVEVKLSEKDPLERDRMVTLGDRLWAQGNGSIDIETLHTQFYGYTQEESQKIVAKMLVDKMTINNPNVQSMLAMVFGEESGLEDQLKAARRNSAKTQNMQQQLAGMPPPQLQGARPPEVLTEQGFEMMDMSLSTKGARNPPVQYQQGQ